MSYRCSLSVETVQQMAHYRRTICVQVLLSGARVADKYPTCFRRSGGARALLTIIFRSRQPGYPCDYISRLGMSDYFCLIALFSPDPSELDTSLDAYNVGSSSCLGRSDASSSTNCVCCAKWLSSVRKRLVVRRTGDQLGQRISAHWEWIPRRFAVAADVQRSVAANSCVQL